MKGEHGASIIQTAYKKGDGDHDGDANQPRSTKYKVAIHANVNLLANLSAAIHPANHSASYGARVAAIMLRLSSRCLHRTSAPVRYRMLCACSSKPTPCSKQAPPPTEGGGDSEFWKSRPVWRRAAANTLRCLVGCSLGDLSALYLLQTHAAALPVAATVATACAAGIGTSLALETVVLRATEGFAWPLAARTAWNMSLVSMIAMELAENAVEIGLSGGVGCFSLAALPPALLAGFLAPLPYNYYMIRKHGRSCH